MLARLVMFTLYYLVLSDFFYEVNAVPATVLWVALPDCLLQLNVEKRQLLPALILLHLVKYGRIKVVHCISSFQQEVVPHGLKVFQEPEGTQRAIDDVDEKSKNKF